MRLVKIPNKNSGYDIYLIIANRRYLSYWTSPPLSIDHVDLKYLKERYPKINTNKRVEEFKALFKNLWIEVSLEQESCMKHCIGINYSKKPYRNYFFTDTDSPIWNELVDKGLAIKSKRNPDSNNCVYFFLSKQGVEFILKKSITKEFYDKL